MNSNLKIGENERNVTLILQGVCDTNYLLTDCYIGEAGSVHDACVFRRSLVSQKLLQTDPQNYIIGDSAYKLSQHLIVPYRDNGHLNRLQINFNKAREKTRVVIEQSFALLKGRFRRLKLLENFRADLMPGIIMAACILHNLCILNGDNFLEDINMQNEVAEKMIMNINNFENQNQNILVTLHLIVI
ncbi:hypothetical protein NQ315_012472 [Exocentrus adspersus]|uniref:DDE Tnp4 domain-containing protein n=1 Tax=Exocentrus adspersus TaxID=1586481 RepID=A0AAV8VMI8_9CUCU|nr:hypothetical protein NQ315_012472 [Exocentrus adspersus]